ncbi:histone H3 methyltransferase SUV39H1/Clr4 [Penicillium frequentans]|uniref:Histone H3 methyltransferase SUV39H1/Clr4 n=1 Tax=Penicillium frequentans TaxID=3151616 RepID=A0AAD6D4L8_9EURO|nr:histone H3 methyltransferase SUV39H1/Clr4 [Penicillium glabrum]
MHLYNIPINNGIATKNTNFGYLLLQTNLTNGNNVAIVTTLTHNQLGSSSSGPNKRKAQNSDIPTTSIETDSGTNGAASTVVQPKVEPSRSLSRKPSLRPSRSKEPREPNGNVSASPSSSRSSLRLSRSKDTTAKTDRLSTPSAAIRATPQIVIPSSAKRTKQLLALPISGEEPKLKGVSEEYFPISRVEKQKALKRAYPKRDKVDRSIIPFCTSSESAPTIPQPDPIAFLRANLDERLRQIDGPAVTFDIDDERLAMLSTTFGFVNDYILLDGVTRVPEGFHYGCNCSGSGPCDLTTCDCLFEEEESNQKISTYHPLENGQFVLHPSFLERRSKIAECCSLCSCKGLEGGCWNTVVQRGRQIRFEIFDTGPRGNGLRSPDPIIAGQFIDRYLGEVLTQEAADARETTNNMGQSYLFVLDWKQEDQDDDDDEDDEHKPDQKFYVVDGQKFGSPTRFINHSCNPNCKIIPVSTTEPGDDSLYHLAFFALCDIPPGTELTFDYNPFWVEKDTDTDEEKDKEKEKVDPNAVTCLCGEDNCRGQLWPNARKQGPGVKSSPNSMAKTAKKSHGKNSKK